MYGRPVLPAGLVRRLELRRALIDADGRGVGYAAVAGGVGEVRDAVAAHALGEVQRQRPHLLHPGGARRAAAVREQMPARALGRLEPGAADPELLQALLDEPARWSGRGSSARRASACSGRRRPRRPGASMPAEGLDEELALRRGRAELRHVTPRRAAAAASPGRREADARRRVDRGVRRDGRALMADRAPSAPAFSQVVSAAWNCGEFGSIPAPASRSGSRWSGRGRSGTRARACSGRPSRRRRASAGRSCGVPRCRRSGAGACRRRCADERGLLRDANR